MADAKTIDQLPNKSSLAGSDMLPVDDGAQSYKVLFSNLLAAIPGLTGAALSQDGTSIVVTYRDGTTVTLRTSDPEKQDALTFDQTPTDGSNNPVTSDGIADALAAKQDTLTLDNVPTENSDNPVKSGGVYTALAAKQDELTFDNAPTENSNNPVKSGGVFTALDGLSAQIGVIVKIMASAHTDDWNVIKQVVEQGYGSIAYPVGSQFAVNHADYGSLLFDVVQHISPESDALHKEMLPSGKDYGMVLMLHHVIYNTQFDQTEAFYYAENGLTAGTYNIKIVRQPWFAGDVGKYFQFTLASDVPAGGVLCWDGYDKTREGRNVTVYESLSAATAQQTAAMTEGQGGTSLGDIDGTGSTNHFDRSVLGSNDWEESGVRQWLNAETQSGWWEPKTDYDRIVSYSSRSGFFYGLPSDFKNAIVVSNHKNRSNTVFDSHGTNQAYSTQDKIWLPSSEEVGLGSEQSIVCGKVFDYYKNAANADRIKYDITSQTTARNWWLRVPNPIYSSHERIVLTSGALSSYFADYALGVAPACIL